MFMGRYKRKSMFIIQDVVAFLALPIWKAALRL